MCVIVETLQPFELEKLSQEGYQHNTVRIFGTQMKIYYCNLSHKNRMMVMKTSVA